MGDAAMDQDALPLPVKPGDWVANRFDSGKVAKVKAAYRLDGEVLVDLVLYARSGDVIGRESPAMGGPRSFEPCCAYSNWRRVESPPFPLRLVWVDEGDGKRTASYFPGEPLEDRAWIPRRRKGGAGGSSRNFDPDLEAKARRMAAQELRDAAKLVGGSEALVARARELEAEADGFRPRGR